MELTEAGLKTILKEQREEYQRYLGVLNENFTSQVKLVAETLGGIQQQLTSIKEINESALPTQSSAKRELPLQSLNCFW